MIANAVLRTEVLHCKPVQLFLINGLVKCHCSGSDLRPLALLGLVGLRVATAAANPTKQHKEVAPSLIVSSQSGVSVFR